MVQYSYLEQFARDKVQNNDKPQSTSPTTNASKNGESGKSGSGSTGFSKQQIQELGELFGIRSRDTDNDDHQDSQGSEPPSPPAHRANSDNDDNGDDIELKMDRRDISPLSSPPNHGVENEGGRAAASSAFELSLVRQFDASGSVLAASASAGVTKTAAAAGTVSLSRISLNGDYVAGSAIGSKVVTIWTTQKDSSSGPASTIRLLSPLSTISWLTTGPHQDQVCLLLSLYVAQCCLLTED